ncbi:ATP-binding protein [Deinococcus sedimenti]|uniref:histidine kinase n=1 Tax=Deinococcus sedimenti TaxID=1867090 RepID=A0ABQ2S667_9DEIO|nr:ATP-binding protein [Deinococcus sedimenti]GGS01509.1 hypothetical protein GCM10008960_30290 [Deinococcus sedimenti]
MFSGAPFTSADEDFLRLIGQWLEQDAAREQTARQLRRSEELNKAVIRSALDGIITCDEQGVITEFNPAAEHMFGHARSLALGRTLDQLFRPAAVPADPSPLPLTGPHSVLGQRLERQAQRRDGTPFLVELSVVHLPTERPEYAAFLRDITERRAAEHRLQQRTAQLDSVFNVSPDGFVIFDGAGHVIEVNPAFLALTGTRLHDLLHQTEATFEQVLRSRCVAARPGGLTGPDVIQVAQPIRRVLKRTRRAMGGSGLGSVMYFRDITHEAEISSMKSEFMSTAAHELRTPMTSIYGFTELLLTRTLDAETTRDLLDTIYRQAGQLLNLLTELLDLARIEARTGQDFIIQPEPVRPLIENTARAFTPPAEQGRVRLAVTPNLPLLPVDAAKFNQALGNVLSNAFKYAPSGPITVRAALTPDHTALQVTVQDHGIGMTPEQTHRAFERFYRADNSGNVPGTGLGLSLVQEIMWGHHGEATLESAAGHGTTVTLTFPTTPLPPHRSSRMPKKILIVDDHADLRKLIRLTLTGPDYDLQEAATGDDALTRTRQWRPDLLILDVMMPGHLNGFQVCESLKRDPELRGTSVMLVTARAQTSDLQEGGAVGADAYLIKPFSPMELLERVGNLLQRP